MTKHFRPRATHLLPAHTGGAPIVAIVGRPNVGKSTLFNRLVRKRIALVHDEPGVTRDRHYANATAFGQDYVLVDTGGFDPDSTDPMKTGIVRHIREAIREADTVLFVTDTSDTLTSADRAVLQLLRASDKPVIYAANKADSPKRDADAFELYRFGMDTVIPISALHGRGISDLEEALIATLPAYRSSDDDPQGNPIALSKHKRVSTASPGSEFAIKARVRRAGVRLDVEHRERDLMAKSLPGEAVLARVAIIGRPNAGKSSLMNRLIGEQRMLVDDRPGTTRDAIDALVIHDSRRYVFIDTAGIRRKGKVAKAEDQVESLSVGHAIRSIEQAETVVLLCDANEGVAEQDAKILGLANDRGRSMIIALNKCDLLSKDELKTAEESARDKISFAPFVPVVRISAKTGRGLPNLFQEIDRSREGFSKRIGTGALNRFFETVLAIKSPPTSGGRAPRLYYITQAETSPPKFVIISNAPDAIHFSYQRFVVNQLRQHFGFGGVPIRVFYKEKRRVKLSRSGS